MSTNQDQMIDNLLFSRINVPAAVWSHLLGLKGKKKTISEKYFLIADGDWEFDQICRLTSKLCPILGNCRGITPFKSEFFLYFSTQSCTFYRCRCLFNFLVFTEGFLTFLTWFSGCLLGIPLISRVAKNQTQQENSQHHAVFPVVGLTFVRTGSVFACSVWVSPWSRLSESVCVLVFATKYSSY